ncbi:MAG TPA: RimK family protein [Paludibacteraceae bacterium]|nr:RimK family protein [Paludibacteraceae bacterium]
MNNVFIILNNLDNWKPYYETDTILTTNDYLEHRYTGDNPKLIINLTDSYSYNSEGYYCSLLGQARGHKVIPAIDTINKLETGTGMRMSLALQKICHQWITKNNIKDTWHLNIYFGTCAEKGLEKIAHFIFENYPCPLLQVTFNNSNHNQIESILAIPLSQLSESEQDLFANALDNFSKKVWRVRRTTKPARYSLAILYDPEEKFPPSDKQAINKFLEIAKKMDIHAELITEEDSNRLMEFDALFIRTTTSLNHYTYHLAQLAAQNNMPVIDDPISIIKCTNKVYLSELFQKAKIPAPASLLVFRSNGDNNTFENISAKLGSPFILKIPDGSFSYGMHKVSDEKELDQALDKMFKDSSILLAQEFTPTEFDWRIGLLDGEPLYACKYYMAKGHWQIYNHAVTGKNLCGKWDTIPIYKVPTKVLETATKAGALIGKGLYGVDLKVVNGKAMVIEINDNPSIDHDVEDEVLGDEIYYRILNYFIHQLNKVHASR